MKIFLVIIGIIISILLIDGYVLAIPFLDFLLFPPMPYWLTDPSSFEECKQATRGFVIKTKPLQCEYNGNNFTEGENLWVTPN